MTDAWTVPFDRLADRYDRVVPFFAEFAAQHLDVVAPGQPLRRNLEIAQSLSAAGFVDVRTVNLAVHLPAPAEKPDHQPIDLRRSLYECC